MRKGSITPDDALISCLRIFAARGRKIREAAEAGKVASQDQDSAAGDPAATKRQQDQKEF